MLNKFIDSFNKLITKLVLSLRRFPQALLLSFAVVTVLIVINHTRPGSDMLSHVAMTLALGIPLSLCIKMFMESTKVSRGKAILIYAFAALALLGYYRFLLPNLEMVAVTRYIAFSLTLYLFFTIIPFLRRKEGYEFYVIKLLTGFIITYFYSLILFAGLAAILFTINTLFSAGISSKVYFDLWLIVVGVFAPAYFLAGIPEGKTAFKINDYPKFLEVLLLYFVMPLLAVYTAILYIYFLKILITRNWPAGIVSNLVLWYGFISTAAMFFGCLLKEKHPWARFFTIHLPRLILPLLLMMFVAMGIRINAYGVTENRYLVLAGGLWTAGSMLYYTVKKNPVNRNIVLAAALISVLAVTGPWSCYTVSKLSQNIRWEKLLSANNMLAEGKIVPNQLVSSSDKEAITSIVRYFDRYHSLRELKHLPADFQQSRMKDVLGFEMTYGRETRHFSHNLQDEGAVQNIQGYDYFLPSLMQRSAGEEIKAGTLTITYIGETRTLSIFEDGRQIYHKDITAAAESIHASHINNTQLNNEEMTFIDENEDIKIMLLFRHINGKEDGSDGKPQIEWLDFMLFVKHK